jgi:hypothetical protein
MGLNTKYYISIFTVVNVITIIFAIYTDHRWEDWYITFKASKNLALGNGLVYHVGEHVHTFTSPIGTLVPAALSFLGGGEGADEFAIWGYRIICSIILSTTAMLIFRLFIHLGSDVYHAFWVVLLFAFNILIVDFSINGMETAFMVLFLILFISIVVISEQKKTLKLALCVAALMYTRPDAVVYFGSLMIGFILFYPEVSNQLQSRKKSILFFMKVGLLAFVFYLPWILITYIYYGSPIPHTIVAKGLNMIYSVKSLAFRFVTMPYQLITYNCTPANTCLMPPYSNMGSWSILPIIGWLSVLIGALYFLNFKGIKIIRAISFSFYIGLFYLFAVNSAMPWYLPNITIVFIVCIGLVLQHHIKNRYAKRSIQFGFLFYTLIVFLTGAKSMKTQQEVIEFGNRKVIGIWLKDNAKKGQSVFMECLGYIGYYSELKTFDFPGMSSPEIVAARKKIPKSNKIKRKKDEYAYIIADLRPDWLVLRPVETEIINGHNNRLLQNQYMLVKEFNVASKIPSGILGENYLRFDQEFRVYKKVAL